MDRLVVYAVTLVTFLAVALAIQAAYWSRISQQENRERHLARRLGNVRVTETEGLLRLGLIRPEKNPVLGWLEGWLIEAGQPYTPGGFAIRTALWATGGVVLISFLVRSPLAFSGLLLALFPLQRLRAQALNRRALLAEQLPDAMDLIARSLQAGHGIPDALRAVADELPRPVAYELGRVYEEHSLGADLRECLHRLVDRNRSSFDIRIFVSSVLLQRETGGNLVEILTSLSATVRARFLFYGKVRALTAEARLTAAILGFLPFLVGFGILWIRPTYLHPLFADPLGQLLLLYAGVSFIVGVAVMRWLARVEV